MRGQKPNPPAMEGQGNMGPGDLHAHSFTEEKRGRMLGDGCRGEEREGPE